MIRPGSDFGRKGTVGLIWLALAAEAAAQPRNTPPDRPAPDERLGQVAEAYQRLDAYADQGELVVSYKQRDALQSTRLAVPLRFVRPDRFLWDAGVTGVATDGRQVTVVNQLASPFLAITAEDFLRRGRRANPTVVVRGIPEPPTGDEFQLLLLAGPTFLEILKTFVTDPDAATKIQAMARSLQNEPDRLLDGRPVEIVRIQPRVQACPIRLWIDRETRLLRRMDLILPREPEPVAAGVQANEAREIGLAWTSGSILTDRSRVGPALDVAMKDRLARTVDLVPPPMQVPASIPAAGPLPPIPSKGMPPVPSKTLPTAAPPEYVPAPQAPAKTMPGPVSEAKESALGSPIRAVSLLIVQPTAQGVAPWTYGMPPPSVGARNSLYRRIHCWMYPADCKD